ncbi:ankyrin repeat-containing domain protein [Colletotrichum acutatum]|uniref:Ankyrin repeat-containing domain protein n=1 Tax=Glomerella acutata TaxID=27357 RepID=A0AAD8UBJ6_GLOAC|nr:ankyrin repeat-containing domain protein [Colletotrichum acutatum]KAK1718122.1 ankyrin repeat-containing domain protein [Colletotrichum acutatum]
MVREINIRPETRETEARRRELAEVAPAIKPEVYGSGVDATLDRQLQELVDDYKSSGSGEFNKGTLMDPKPREAIDQGWIDVGTTKTEMSLDTQDPEPVEQGPARITAPRAEAGLDRKLHELTAEGFLSELRDLLQQGANPNTLSARGTLPLCEHARRGNLDAAKLLLDHEADVNLSDASGRTAISYATETTNPAMARLLMAVPGIDVNLKDGELRAPVWYALCAWIKSGRIFVPDTDTLFVLLEDERVRVEDVNGEGRGLLHLAAAAGAGDLVEFLCDRSDVDVNRRDGRGYTAVAYALGVKNVRVLGVLLKYGAGITVAQGKGFEVVSPRRRRRWVEGRWCYARIID